MYDYNNGYDDVDFNDDDIDDDYNEAEDNYETMEPEEFLEKYLGR